MRLWFFSALVGCLLLVGMPPVRAETPAPSPIVHAVLFISPTCRHCQQVLKDILPPLRDEYSGQLEVIIFDINLPEGKSLFLATVQAYAVPSSVVPLLIVGDTYLLGTTNIADRFPGMIDDYLSLGGVALPVIPGLVEGIAAQLETQAYGNPPESSSTTTPPGTPASPVPSSNQGSNNLPVVTPAKTIPGFTERLRQDPIGYSLALLVLAVLFVSLLWGAGTLFSGRHSPILKVAPWLIPSLCIAGLVVAGYLAYVETSQVEAYCGIVGDCNAVQQSGYARLFGILPIGVLGLAGYLAILVTWLVSQRGLGRMAAFASLADLVLAAAGVLFSIWLTWLELFVIQAVCAWCLTSAILMSALFLACVPPAKAALRMLMDRASMGIGE